MHEPFAIHWPRLDQGEGELRLEFFKWLQKHNTFRIYHEHRHSYHRSRSILLPHEDDDEVVQAKSNRWKCYREIYLSWPPSWLSSRSWIWWASTRVGCSWSRPWSQDRTIKSCKSRLNSSYRHSREQRFRATDYIAERIRLMPSGSVTKIRTPLN